MVLLKQLWPYMLGVSMLAYIYVLHQNIKVYKADIRTAEQAISIQNVLIEINAADYENKLAALPKEVIKIKNNYITKYIEVIKWKDENVTDCKDSISYLNNFNF